jgi:hypothetical protein
MTQNYYATPELAAHHDADCAGRTGHVAQYFLDDQAWCQVLTEAHRTLQPDGHLAFEVRNDAVEEWRTWSTDVRTRMCHREGLLASSR